MKMYTFSPQLIFSLVSLDFSKDIISYKAQCQHYGLGSQTISVPNLVPLFMIYVTLGRLLISYQNRDNNGALFHGTITRSQRG